MEPRNRPYKPNYGEYESAQHRRSSHFCSLLSPLTFFEIAALICFIRIQVLKKNASEKSHLVKSQEFCPVGFCPKGFRTRGVLSGSYKLIVTFFSCDFITGYRKLTVLSFKSKFWLLLWFFLLWLYYRSLFYWYILIVILFLKYSPRKLFHRICHLFKLPMAKKKQQTLLKWPLKWLHVCTLFAWE